MAKKPEKNDKLKQVFKEIGTLIEQELEKAEKAHKTLETIGFGSIKNLH